jgi:hypothetical protein
MALATVKPPIPESNIPIGQVFNLFFIDFAISKIYFKIL